MTAALIYSAIALAILILAAVLLRPRTEDSVRDTEMDLECAQGALDESSLRLAERVFDPGDYRWLRDEVGFPHLARALARARRELALKWLRALRHSFEETLRTPRAANDDSDPNEARRSWRLLWMTLRFRLLLGYAVFVVRCFGPYHRLIPSLDWAEALLEPPPAEEEERAARISYLH